MLDNSNLMAGDQCDELELAHLASRADIAETRLSVFSRDLSLAKQTLAQITKSGGHPAILAQRALDEMVTPA